MPACPPNESADYLPISPFFTNNIDVNILNTQERVNCEALVQGLGVGIIKHDVNGRIVVSNKAALQMLGLTEEEMYGKTSINSSWNVIHEDGRIFPGEEHPIAIAIKTKRPQNNVVMGVFRPKMQSRIWLLVNAEPQFDKDGQFADVLVTFTDITAYKKVQDELHIKTQILDSISSNSLDIIGVMDVTGQYHYVSKAALIISGYSQEELLQVNALDLAPKKTKEYIRQLLLSLPKVGKVENMLGKIICKDGSVKYISWSFKWDEVAELIYVNGRDKTQEVKKAREAEAKRIAEELEKRHLIFKAEDQKLNNISYELHENVGQIIATVKMYLESYEKTNADAILQEAKSMLTLCINELRAITYINSTPRFDEVGFANAIEILMQLQFKKQEVVHAVKMLVNDKTISERNKINIYRLLQLWLNHIITRESLASVVVEITEQEDMLIMEITDEVKFPMSYTDYLSPDLMPIKERLNIIGGSMTLQPCSANKCFTIKFMLKKESN